MCTTIFITPCITLRSLQYLSSGGSRICTIRVGDSALSDLAIIRKSYFLVTSDFEISFLTITSLFNHRREVALVLLYAELKSPNCIYFNIRIITHDICTKICLKWPLFQFDISKLQRVLYEHTTVTNTKFHGPLLHFVHRRQRDEKSKNTGRKFWLLPCTG